MKCPRGALLYPTWESSACSECGALPTEECKKDKKRQEGGTHYADMAVQPLDVMRSAMSRDELRGFLWGNCIKYGMRWQAKGGVEDLRKLRHYTDMLIEHEVEG